MIPLPGITYRYAPYTWSPNMLQNIIFHKKNVNIQLQVQGGPCFCECHIRYRLDIPKSSFDHSNMGPWVKHAPKTCLVSFLLGPWPLPEHAPEWTLLGNMLSHMKVPNGPSSVNICHFPKETPSFLLFQEGMALEITPTFSLPAAADKSLPTPVS